MTPAYNDLQPVPPQGLAVAPGAELAPLARRPYYAHDSRLLPGAPSSVREARAYVRAALTSWCVPVAVVDDLLIIISELATNAVEHTTSTRIRIVVVLTVTAAQVAVIDQGPRRPIRPRPTPADESGRGLSIVEALAERWGHRRAGAGSAVWARAALPEQAA